MKMKTPGQKSEHDSLRKVRLTRVYRFSAAHRLYSPKFTDEENWKIYGKCSNPFGHGHNYVLEITVEGIVDQITGKVCNLEKLDEIVQREILDLWDHRNLDQDVRDFQGKTSTGENIVRIVWEKLSPFTPLASLKLQETRDSWFEYDGPS